MARTFSTLDHLTEGRVAWNVVTSWSQAAANAFGMELQPHDKSKSLKSHWLSDLKSDKDRI